MSTTTAARRRFVKLAWKGAKLAHPAHGKLAVRKAKTPTGTFTLYRVPGEKLSTLDFAPAKPSRQNPGRRAQGPVAALLRLAATAV